MLKFIQSANLKQLAAYLADNIDKEIPDDPLIPVDVIVPNHDIANWLTLQLVEKQGVVANMNFLLPSEWFWKQVRKRNPDLPHLLPSDRQPMSWSIFSVFKVGRFLDKLPEIQSYLDRHADTGDLTAYQLAVKISSVFDEYQVYRPSMLKKWKSGSVPADSNFWQAELWNILQEEWQNSGDTASKKDRAGLFFETLEQLPAPAQTDKTPLYIFNPGLIPNPLNQLLLELSESVNIYFFRISSVHRLMMKKPEEFYNSLLQELAHEQVEKVQILREQSDSGLDNLEIIQLESLDRKPDTVLKAIQNSVYNDKALPEFGQLDSTVEIHCCHSPLREVEELKNYLTGLFSSDSDIKPDDVLVVTPDLDLYSPFIEAVFGTEEEGMPTIPYNMPSSFANNKTEIRRIFRQMLKLLTSRFYRNDIFDFLRNAPVSASFQLSESDVEMLSDWMQENRVVWGADENHRQEFNQPGTSLQTWKQAFKRGWDGQLMATGPGEIVNNSLLFPGIESRDEKETWAALHYLLSLLNRARYEVKTARPAKEWKNILYRWISQFLPSGWEYEDDIEQLFQLITQVVEEIETGGYQQELSFNLIRFVLTKKLDNSFSVTGSYCNGVQFQSMVPARSIPAKVVALIGLNDDLFPRKSARAEFDLMLSDPLPGERDRKKEDRNLFLESIMAAEKIHYTSYTGKSIKDDEDIPPSPILYQWIHLLTEKTTSEFGEIVKVHNLHGFSPAYFKQNESNSFSSVYLKTARSINSVEKIPGLVIDQPLPEQDEVKSGVHSLYELESFFGNPVRSFFTQRMHVRLPDYQRAVEREFRLDGLSRHILFQHLFGWILQGQPADKIENLLFQSGMLPEGWPGRNKLTEMMESVKKAVSAIREQDFEPGLRTIDIDLLLNGKRLYGEVQSYSDSFLLDLHPSKESGKRVLKSWLRHLVLCACPDINKHLTTVFMGFRSGKQKWIRFNYVDHSAELLINLMQMFKAGMSAPVNLYIDSGYEYQLRMKKYNDEKAALDAARKTWSNDFNNFSENQDPYLQLLLGTDPDLDPDQLAEYSEKIYKPLIRHREVL